MKFTPPLVVLGLLLVLAAGLRAQTQTSEILGCVRTTALPNTDSFISAPLARPAVWAGTVGSGEASATRLTVSGSPGWTTDQFAPGASTYHVRVLTGLLRGQFLTVVSNDANSLQVDPTGFDLTVVAPGEKIELAPYWTLGSLYPASQAGVSFIPSTSSLVRQTELYFYDAAGNGINRAPSVTYFFYNGAWRKVGATITLSFDRTVVPPDSYFIQRNKAAASTPTFVGRVHAGALGTLIETRAGVAQDNYMAVGYPLGATLRRIGLAGSAAFTTSTSPLVRADQLLVYDPTQTGINRAASATYFYYNGGWRKVGALVTTDFSDTVTLPATGGFIVRRAAGGTTGAWVFETNL